MKFKMLVMMIGSCITLYGMKEEEKSIGLSSISGFSSEFNNKKITENILKIFSINESEMYPFLLMTIESYELSRPKKYRILKKLVYSPRRNTATKKKDGQKVNSFDFKTQKVASQVIAQALNDYYKAMERKKVTCNKVTNGCIGLICMELGVAACIAAGALIPALINC